MVNYVVALYLGKRRNSLVQDCMDQDPFHLLKSHMLAIHKYKMDGVHKVTFVLNPSENKEAEGKIEEVLSEYRSLCSKKDIEIELIRNTDNKHISYGAWHYGVLSGLNDERTQHFFLLEDDYIPCTDNFHQPYVDRSEPDIAYVCQMWKPATVQKRGEPKGRVAITNGLLNANLSREIFKKHNKCFTLEVTGEYHHLSSSKKMDDVSKKYLLSGPAQKHFVGLYLENGHRIVDLGPNWQQPFLTTRTVRMYNEGNPPTVYPVHEYVPITPESFK